MEKDKAAISVMSGLRQKFARERNKGITYSSDELHIMFSESLNRIKKEEDITFETNESWDEINEQIEKAGIKRYPWKGVFGTSLTQIILTYKKYGFTADQTIEEIQKDSMFKAFLLSHSTEREKIIENIRISVHARYGENETAKKVMGE